MTSFVVEIELECSMELKVDAYDVCHVYSDDTYKNVLVHCLIDAMQINIIRKRSWPDKGLRV
jgi:hypothetical protein